MSNDFVSEPILIKGSSHIDERGQIGFVNSFNLSQVKRFYIISPKNTQVIRAWQAHKFESKYFYCISGEFIVSTVKIDDFNKPSKNLKTHVYLLKEGESNILYIPPGYANGFKAKQKNSKLLVFSDKTIDESKQDDYRFNKNNWINWNKL